MRFRLPKTTSVNLQFAICILHFSICNLQAALIEFDSRRLARISVPVSYSIPAWLLFLQRSLGLGTRLRLAAKHGWQVPVDPHDSSQRYLAPARMNFCREPKWLPFRIGEKSVEWGEPLELLRFTRALPRRLCGAIGVCFPSVGLVVYH